MVYKTVFPVRVVKIESPETSYFRDLSRNLAEDEVYRYLLKNSSLTRKQAETIIFDILTSHGYKLTAREKALLRGVSKGSFLRTRHQALRNISRALHTLLLLSYLGIIRLPDYSWFFQMGEAVEGRDVESLRRILNQLEETVR